MPDQSTAENTKTSIRKKMIVGSLWMVGMRWVIRAIGLISTAILARLLTPADFGLIAMAMLFIGLLEVLASFGVDMALIKDQNAKRAHYDTAWTFKVIQGLLLGTVLFIAAPHIALYFDEEKVINVVRVLALAIFISGFQNIGIVAFRKELDFAKEFKFLVYTKIINFFITIFLAFYFRNYWALVAGIVFSRFFSVALSYVMHPFRPGFSLEKAGDLWDFSKWMVILSLGSFITSKIDEFVIGGTKPTEDLGIYNVGADLALMPGNEIIIPASRALFPGYAKLAHDPPRLAQAFLNVISMAMLVGISTSVGLMLIADDAVSLLLGSQWGAAVPVIQALALYAPMMGFRSIVGNLLVASGRVKWVAIYVVLFLFLLVPSIIISANYGDLADVALTRTILSILAFLISLYMVTLCIPVRMIEILDVTWRPCVAVIIMALSVNYFHIDTELPITSLLIDITVGIISFSIGLLLLWWLSGKPDGTEYFLIDKLKVKLKNLT